MRIFILAILLISVAVGPFAYAETEAERRARLEAELSKIESDIEVQQVLLDEKSGERQSLERDVAVLDGKINKAQLGIKQRNLTISQIANDVSDREQAIRALDAKVIREKSSLAQLIRKTNEIDNLSFPEMILGSDDLSSIFVDLDSFDVVKVSLSSSFELIASTRIAIEGQKQVLKSEQVEEQELRRLQVLAKDKVEDSKDEKDVILRVTKGEEARYQQYIKEKEKSAAEIRTTLFALRGTAAIPFGDAYDFAQQASAATGVRPALILGILAQESNLGENVGTGNWVDDMHPTRDRPVFEQITLALGLNPDTLPVSRKPWYGWGGAMGPAQFIPSTWVCYGGFINTVTNDCNNSKRSLTWNNFWQGPWKYKTSKDRLRKMMDVNVPSNPWDARTAIFGTATLMMDNGADKGTRESERLAALRYFAGWTNAKKASYAFYGDGVMELADKFQRQIEILEG